MVPGLTMALSPIQAIEAFGELPNLCGSHVVLMLHYNLSVD